MVYLTEQSPPSSSSSSPVAPKFAGLAADVEPEWLASVASDASFEYEAYLNTSNTLEASVDWITHTSSHISEHVYTVTPVMTTSHHVPTVES